MRNVLLGLVLASGTAGMLGCNSGVGTPASDVIQSQVEYNMVIADDRAKFREEDLAYQGSVGPYAVYKITGANPKLVGPYIKAPTNYGFAMACGAQHYFSVQKSVTSPNVTMQLRGGHAGSLVLVEAAQHPQDQGGCTTPTDTFGNPVPDMGGAGGGGSGGGGGGSGGGTPGGGGGGTGCTSPEGGCGTPGGGGGGGGAGGSGGANPGGSGGTTGGGFGDNGAPGSGASGGGATPGDGNSGNTGVQQIGLTMNPPPPVGSTILVRRVALTAARQHNGSHVERNVCCAGNVCSLQ